MLRENSKTREIEQKRARMNVLEVEYNQLEQEIQELENIDNQKSVEKIFIAKAKLEALESKFYEKI